ncbi:4Fe-4S binding protein [Abyssisolibacter fermentans]|uniref:4Fe-4S binding protein n=1 Tax=Abyssisolibacter fermentans TaxID=1766203 RepID=UPI00082F41F1|nr:4Fe-4S binding protein [Abyssisolibacter fermentans]
MKFNKVTLMYFSPTGTTKKTLENIAKGMDIGEIKHLDLTDFDKRWERRVFEKDELILFGMPVYNGRMVPVAKEIFNRTAADGTLCVPIVVYGNRAYEDALLELKNGAEKCGFKSVAAAAFVGEHSFNNGLGAGRPDETDAKEQEEFGQKILEKISSLSNLDDLNIKVPGNFPYKHSTDLPISPTVNDKCKNCGKCVEICPMKAIDPNNPKRTDNFRCILCYRCVRNCPEGAREVSVPKFKEQIKLLAVMAHDRKEPEIFI